MATITVNAGGNVQAAIDSSSPGDVIVLEAGASFTGFFTLPNKGGSTNITIRSSNMASIPPGVRVSPASAGFMPKLLTSGSNEAALRTLPSAHHYIIEGIEIAPSQQSGGYIDLMSLGSFGTNQDTLGEIPHHFLVDRCYIHAYSGSQSVRRGIALNSADTDITNCHISGIKASGQDSQAICGWNGSGNYNILNNYLEAAGENIMFGGSDPSITNLVPTNITVKFNHMYKPMSWRGGGWTVKNIFELKNAKDVVCESNVLENLWGGEGQGGYAVLFTVRNQDGTAAWSAVQNVTFAKNIVKSVGSVFNILGNDNFNPSETTTNININNNLCYDVSGISYNSIGNIILVDRQMGTLVFDHNTVQNDGKVMYYAGGPHGALTFTNNITQHINDRNGESIYGGIRGDGQDVGSGTLDFYVPTHTVRKNVFIMQDNTFPMSSKYPDINSGGKWRSNNVGVANNAAVGFIDPTNANTALLPTSPYYQAGLDGKDIGCDFSLLPAGAPGGGGASSVIKKNRRWFLLNT